jgi:hypothetical protein
MRITTALGLVLVASFAAPAFGQSFVGEWTATAQTPGGGVSETINVVKTGDGYALTAKLVVPIPNMPEGGPGTEIVLNGDSFSYKRTVTTPGGDLVVTYTGVVSGDTFTGKVELGAFGSAPYNGVRVRHDKK